MRVLWTALEAWNRKMVPLVGFELTTYRLQVRKIAHFPMLIAIPKTPIKPIKPIVY